MKSKRVVDEDALARYRGKPCAICSKPSDPAHIKSRGSGGNDADWNLISLCREHHSIQHSLGWTTFFKKHPIIKAILTRKGWSLDERGKLVR